MKVSSEIPWVLSCFIVLSFPVADGFAGSGSSIVTVANTCNGVKRAEIKCDSLDPGQLWFPDQASSPTFPPGDALLLSEKLIGGLDFGKWGGGIVQRRIEIMPCGLTGGWIYVVFFLVEVDCGHPDGESIDPVSIGVLMDGTVVELNDGATH